ncbi:MAG: acetyl/propionyl/methylcrotonyl-CoA carboxylase subunit alpha [Oligoflexus sp.]
MKSRQIKQIFIANRGEIARRIATTAKKMGIKTAALYSGNTPPAFLSAVIDSWYELAEETPAVYLNGSRLIQIAKDMGCDAVHPGFGFLSENAGFARAVTDAGMVWIGPDVAAIEAMASKASARELAMKHEVPCIPGCQLSGESSGRPPQEVADFVERNGLPILIKAALGGGGKGMRVVRKLDELEQQIQRAASEAQHAFGDSSLIIETYLENPRHIEVQVLADQHGQVFTIGDRDCSLQRRHQKIIEEAPAPNLHPTTRQRMHDAAQRLAAAVKYVSAGTVEFLIEGSPESEQKYYFLEMNTRLQVEHPVTEEVYQLDLVEWQLRVARGESLPATFADLPAQCHSIEARIYAEDPQRDFFPAPGPVYAFLPAQIPQIRWEPGIDGIDEISPSFDPMIAKLIANGSNRREAIENLRRALAGTVYCGPPANLEFLYSILDNYEFQSGQISTFYLGQHLPEILERLSAEKKQHQSGLESVMDELHYDLQAQELGQTQGLATVIRNCFQNHGDTRPTYHLNAPQRSSRTPGSLIQVGFVEHFLQGQYSHIPLTRVQSPDHDAISLYWQGFQYSKTWVKESQASAMQRSLESGSILSPVPGRVVKILVSEGALVSENQTLVILESMKMEFEVKAPRDAEVKSILVDASQQVQADDLLLQLEISESEQTR